MNRKEIFQILDVHTQIIQEKITKEEADEYFMDFITSWTKGQGNIAIYFISKFNDSLSTPTKTILSNYILLTLVSPEIADQSQPGPLVILGQLLNNLTPQFDTLRGCLSYICSIHSSDELEPLIIPLIYALSLRCSKRLITEDWVKYACALRTLINLDKIPEIFKKSKYWGLEPSNENNINLSFLTFYYSCNYEPPTNFPCFLDGFLEPFLYHKKGHDHPIPSLLGQTIPSLRNIAITTSSRLDELSSMLYEVLNRLLRFSPIIKQNFIQYLCMIIRSNKDRSKIIYDYKSCSSDGFVFNMDRVLTRFCGNMNNSKHIDLIDIRYSEDISGTTSFSTAVFFSKIKFSEFSTIKALEQMKLYSREMERIREDASSEIIRKVIESNQYGFRVLYFSEVFLRPEESFIEFMVSYALSHKNNEEKNNIFNLPQSYFNTLFEIKHFLLETYGSSLISPDMFSLIEELICKNISNPHFKLSIVKILYSRHHKLTPKLLDGLAEYYIAAKKIDSSFYDKYSVRYYINYILRNDNTCIINKTNNLWVKFINCVIDDLEYLMSTALTAIMDIKKHKKMLEEILDQEEINSLHETIADNESTATNSFIFVKESCLFVCFISSSNASLFMRREVVGKFVNVLNSTLKMIVGPRCNDLNVPEAKRYNFEPKELLRLVVSIYLSMHRSESRFAESVAGERMYFNLSLMRRAHQICSTKHILGVTELENLESFIKVLENKLSSKEHESEVVPEEFIDPVTCAPMKEPVKLLTSNVTIDRSTYEIIMVGDGVDPFTREVLDDSKVIVDEEMAIKIKEWKETKRGN
ncbi:Ubiquitin conjugation factor E4 [Astathelohania contejeani]|uniref:Ubiquitin conjugation factor E4 n=1 Tax=Astathelohania contejeani TaxID=164912 RepID=A0ABQ7HXS7_9MICR|nr:Ubiquitin conjugation factor E4 [Thelohania contejeani]